MKKLKKDLIKEILIIFVLIISLIFLIFIDKNILQWILFGLNIFLLSISIKNIIIYIIFYLHMKSISNQFDIDKEQMIKTFYDMKGKFKND
jgi:hypothetical protein